MKIKVEEKYLRRLMQLVSMIDVTKLGEQKAQTDIAYIIGYIQAMGVKLDDEE